MSRAKSAGAVGSFYTGEGIATDLAAQVAALDPRIAVLDPACGDGALLAAVRAVLPDIPVRGMDTDPAAVEACRARGFPAVLGDALFDDVPLADVWVMNPPYVGGGKISTVLGAPYLKRLQGAFETHGQADYCAYFLQRAAEMSDVDGIVAVCTNTIAQGDTRLAGLRWIVERGWEIVWGETNRRWQGEKASVTVSLFAARSQFAYAPADEDSCTKAADRLYRDSGIGEATPEPSADDVARLLANVYQAGWRDARRSSSAKRESWTRCAWRGMGGEFEGVLQETP